MYIHNVFNEYTMYINAEALNFQTISIIVYMKYIL